MMRKLGCRVANTLVHTVNDSSVRGPGFDPTPKPGTAFFQKLSSPVFQTTDLKTITFISIIVMSI